MNSKQIMDSVPDDAPSSTSKPKNNLWTWLVGAFACVITILYGKGISDTNQIIRGRDAIILDQRSTINLWRVSDSLKGVKLDECNAEKLQIQTNGQQQLLEYLELKPGKRQTISISPKQSTR